MRQKKQRTIEVPFTAEGVGNAMRFIEEGLKRSHISDVIISETMLLFEALFHNLVEQCDNQSTLLSIRAQMHFGETYVKLGFEGKPYVPVERTQSNDFSPETGILLAYSDKVSYRYSSGYNTIRIVVKRSYSNFLLSCFAAILLAILVYLPIRAFVSQDAQITLGNRIVFPLIRLFTNGILMVGAPITLFSVIKNLTDVYIVSERSSVGRKLQSITLVTSAISVILAYATSHFIALAIGTVDGRLEGFGWAVSLSEMIDSLVPSNIFDPFETFMPFPMIIVATLITYAFCSVGEYFDVLKKGVDVCYALFSVMLNVVMSALPVFSFLAILKPLLTGGFGSLLLFLRYILLVFASLLVMFAFYLLRLLLGGVKPGPFLRRLPPMLWENLKINSAVDAVPFNIRFCARNYGFDRKRITEKLPVLAQINLDGSCFLIMMFAMMLILLLGVDTTLFQVLVIAVLVLFLSFGAPGQPGAILIGVLIILYYLKAADLLHIAICLEVFFGAIQNLVNVLGDIVTVAIEEQKARTDK